ncbi:DUF2089 domain-containing protein [Caloranaerobacter azorensis]|uniref:DUF2089 domain-containing protein n=1 Tax=Caloranaerobacter azorensis TaxID=116090 RepID=A0A6P1YG21_9FIRM|nr:DUF2089 domain-containing protein [Caloranaerobacter azorensis]QIB27892.1 DUF2089 domain-containing protein [Caloranaerobacter azorensis]
MKDSIQKILTMLEKKEIDVKEAIYLLKSLHPDINKPKKRASKIKITIIDEEKHKINIPAMPFWIVQLLSKAGLKLTIITSKYSKHLDNNTLKYIETLKDIDLNEIFKVLKMHEPFDLVNIEDGTDGSKIKIITL